MLYYVALLCCMLSGFANIYQCEGTLGLFNCNLTPRTSKTFDFFVHEIIKTSVFKTCA